MPDPTEDDTRKLIRALQRVAKQARQAGLSTTALNLHRVPKAIFERIEGDDHILPAGAVAKDLKDVTIFRDERATKEEQDEDMARRVAKKVTL